MHLLFIAVPSIKCIAIFYLEFIVNLNKIEFCIFFCVLPNFFLYTEIYFDQLLMPEVEERERSVIHCQGIFHFIMKKLYLLKSALHNLICDYIHT